MYYVYILRCGDDSLYTGITSNPERRLAEHRSGKGAKYTRSHLPVTPVYLETVPDKSEALRRELEIKRLTRSQKLELIRCADAASGKPSEITGCKSGSHSGKLRGTAKTAENQIRAKLPEVSTAAEK